MHHLESTNILSSKLVTFGAKEHAQPGVTRDACSLYIDSILHDQNWRVREEEPEEEAEMLAEMIEKEKPKLAVIDVVFDDRSPVLMNLKLTCSCSAALVKNCNPAAVLMKSLPEMVYHIVD